MYCPKCKSEYREGFFKCADCGAELIPELHPETQGEVSHEKMVEVFSTYNPGDIAFIKSVLDGEGIHYYFQGESTIMMVGAGAYARLLVQKDQAEHVRSILNEMGFLEN
ncbi:MAG: DUF2007 domain-containing protein [Smithella sp.]